MRSFRRNSPASPSAPDPRVREIGYRRLGHAMATVVVTVEAEPPAGARLSIRSGRTVTTLKPTMLSREAPGTKAEVHRLWFAADLSAVMFGDGDFALEVEGGSVALAQPVALAEWHGEDHAEQAAAGSLVEAELRAAVAALEERSRAAEASNEELKADSRRMGEAVAATLAEVQHEREQLLESVATARPAAVSPCDRPAPAELDRDLLSRIGAARGAAGTAA